jgi:hypothetical protein
VVGFSREKIRSKDLLQVTDLTLAFDVRGKHIAMVKPERFIQDSKIARKIIERVDVARILDAYSNHRRLLHP